MSASRTAIAFCTRGRTVLHAVLLAALLVGCGGGGDSGPGTGTLALSITDAPFPSFDCLSAAKITFDGIDARGPDGWTRVDLTADGDGDGEITVDLLPLRDGIDESLTVVDLPVGAYSEIRLHIVEAMLEFVPELDPETDEILEEFDPQPFKVPSGMSSGLKLKIDPPLMIGGGQLVPVVLDFDLTESWHSTGGGGTPTCEELRMGEIGTIFHPVIRMVNESEIGIVSGTVWADLALEAGAEGADVAAVLRTGDVAEDPPTIDETTPKTLTNEAGDYTLLLPPGVYDLYARAQESEAWVGRSAEDGPATVEVGGIVVDHDITLPASEPTEPSDP